MYQISTPVPILLGLFHVSIADVEVTAVAMRFVTSDGGSEIGMLVV